MRPGTYTITKILPVTGAECRYRVRNAMDTHDRVLDEALLRPADA